MTDEFKPEVVESDGVETVDTHKVTRAVVTDELERYEGQERPTETHDDVKPESDKDDKDDQDDESKDTKRGRFLEDGRYEVTKADGTKIVLDRDELPPAGVSRRKWYQTLTQQVEDSQAALKTQAEQHAAELAAIKQQISEQRQADDVKVKPWLADGATRPSIEDFESVDEWADARDEWKAAQDAHAEPAQPEKADAQPSETEAQAKLARDAALMLEEGAERFPDFDTVVKQNKDAPFDPYMTSFLLAEADDAPAAFHYLGGHVDEARQVRALLEQGDVRGAIRALAKAEARASLQPGAQAGTAHDSGVDTEADTPRPVRASSAPAPIRPVNGTAPPRRDPDREPVGSYIERRRKEELGIR